MTIFLSQDAESALLEEDSGTGGFQSLLKNLRERYDLGTKALILDSRDVERIKRYAKDYGQGGWEEKIKRIFAGNPELLEQTE
jgi:hypothetical protein